jgi:hypothetical protein
MITATWLVLCATSSLWAQTTRSAEGQPPKPRIVPASWELKLDFQPPQPITLTLAGETKPQTFWYMLYRVTNETGKDQIFVPDFVLYTDTGQILRAGEKVPGEVFTAIQQRHNDPLLLDQSHIIGKILQGQDNFKSGLAIWRDIDPQARSFDVFVGGMSGERVKVKLPEPVKVATVDAEGNKQEVTTEEAILSKALHLHYWLPGEAAARTASTPQLEKKEWVMR